MLTYIKIATSLILLAFPFQFTIGQIQNEVHENDGILKPKSINGIPVTEIFTNDESRSKAVDAFRRLTTQLDGHVFASFDYLIRRVRHIDGEIGNPEYEIGKITEDFASGDLFLKTVGLMSVVNPTNRLESKTFGKDWQEEKSRLEKFIKDHQAKKDYLPSDVSLDSIKGLFFIEDFKQNLGGNFIRSEELSLDREGRSVHAVVDVPGLELPESAHYFDVRALGLSNSREIAFGTQLSDVLRRHNTATPFSVEKFQDRDLVTIAFGQYFARRILFDPAKGNLPVYSADYRGGSPPERNVCYMKQGPTTQSWIKPVKVGEFWMPERVRLIDVANLIDIELKWNAFNTDIPEDAFSLNNAGFEAGGTIFDRRDVPPTVTIVP